MFKSINGGGNWEAINTGLTDYNVTALAIDPTTTNTLYAGITRSVFTSTNGGGNWSELNTGLEDTFIRTVAIDPKTPNTLYTGTMDGVFSIQQINTYYVYLPLLVK